MTNGALGTNGTRIIADPQPVMPEAPFAAVPAFQEFALHRDASPTRISENEGDEPPDSEIRIIMWVLRLRTSESRDTSDLLI